MFPGGLLTSQGAYYRRATTIRLSDIHSSERTSGGGRGAAGEGVHRALGVGLGLLHLLLQKQLLNKQSLK